MLNFRWPNGLNQSDTKCKNFPHYFSKLQDYKGNRFAIEVSALKIINDGTNIDKMQNTINRTKTNTDIHNRNTI